MYEKSQIILGVAIVVFLMIVGLIFKYAGSSSSESISNSNTLSTNGVQSNNKMCDWIDKSDIVIQLKLPEKYGFYDDDSVSPSYEVGMMFKSSYGDIASSRRLARKSCDYRVGFSKADFENMNYNPNYPFVIIAYRDSSDDFVYDKEPIKLTLGKNGLPREGKLFIINVKGEVPSYNHYQSIFE